LWDRAGYSISPRSIVRDTEGRRYHSLGSVVSACLADGRGREIANRPGADGRDSSVLRPFGLPVFIATTYLWPHPRSFLKLTSLVGALVGASV